MRRGSLTYWLLAATTIGCLCCCGGRGHGFESAAKTLPDTLRDSMRELPLPDVPPTLTGPQERAEYIIGHFWDGMDFADTLYSRDCLFMEQNFVNFVSLFPHAKQEVLSPNIGKLLKRAASDSVALNLVKDIAERYLDEPNSPMRNEEYYILFLEELLRLPGLSEYERVRPSYRLEMALKNRPGTKAANFTYSDRRGTRCTLHGTRGNLVLLLFYDPACSHCSEILDSLHESQVLGKLVADKELTVLAVYTEGDRKLWDETKDDMPHEWIVSIDNSCIVENEIYSLPAMPVIYLLDKDKKVLLKDPTPAFLESYIVGESN